MISIADTLLETEPPALRFPVNTRYDHKTGIYKLGEINSFVSMGIKVTYKCNQDCIYCCAYGKGPDMPEEYASRVVKELGRSPLVKVDITGGEPLLYDNLMGLLSELREHDIHISLCTNGILLGDAVDNLKGYADNVKISVLGRNETHEKLTRKGGSFDSLKDGLKMLYSAEIPVVAQFVAFRENLDELPHIVEFCADYGVQRLNVYSNIEQGRGNQMLRNGEVPEFEEIREAFERTREAMVCGIIMKLVEWRKKGQYVMIMPNGDMTANPVENGNGNFLRFGNILESPIEDLWDAYPYKDAHMEFYMGKGGIDYTGRHSDNIHAWREIFRAVGLGRHDTVIDLCPGDDPKIECALQEYGFQGLLLAADASGEALEQLKGMVNGKVRYKLEAMVGDITEMSLPAQAYIAGNHVLDDLISYQYCLENDLNYYSMHSDVEHSRRVWDGICREPSRWEGHAIETIRQVSRNLSPNNLLIISQYPSKFELENGFHHETELCSKVLKKMAESLVSNGFLEETERVEGVFINMKAFSPEHWKVLRKR